MTYGTKKGSSKKRALAAFNAAVDDLLDVNREFFASGVCGVVQPLLRIAGAADFLAWPLPAEQARTLSAAATAPQKRTRGGQPSADGRRYEPAALSFDNPSWPQFVAGVVDKARKALDIKDAVRAELHALVVHGPGGQRLPLRDANDAARGVFGSLVIVLPSSHEGGQLRVTHDGQERRFDTADKAGLMQPRWAVFFAGCAPAPTPVTAGCRVTLVYDLIASGPHLPGLPTKSSAAAALAQLARSWGAADLEKIVYVLEDKRAAAAGGWGALRGRDAELAAVLTRTVEFDLFLVDLEMEKTRDLELIELHSSITATGWVPAPAASVPAPVFDAAQKAVFCFSEIAQGEDYCEIEDPDEVERDGGDSDDEECEVHSTYDRAAFVLWPRSKRAAIVGLEASFRLLEAAAAGDRASLIGYPDAGSLQAACAATIAHSSNQSGDPRVLAAATKATPSALAAFLTSGPHVIAGAASAPLTLKLMHTALQRHGCASLRAAVVASAVAAARASERGATGAWQLLAALQGVNTDKLPAVAQQCDVRTAAGGAELIAAVAQALVTELGHAFTEQPAAAPAVGAAGGKPEPGKPSRPTDEQKQAMKTLVVVLRAAAALEGGLCDRAGRIIVANARRFPPMPVVVGAVQAAKKDGSRLPGKLLAPLSACVKSATEGLLTDWGIRPELQKAVLAAIQSGQLPTRGKRA